MKRLVAGALLLVSAVAISVFVTSLNGTSQANSDRPLGADEAPAAASLAPAGAELPVAPTSVHAQEAGGGGQTQVQKQAFVGIMIATLTDDQASEYGVDGGVLVRQVVPGGPADGILHQGDVITALDGENVASAAELVERVRASEPGAVVTFSVVRDGVETDADVTLGEQAAIERRILRGPVMPNVMPFSGGGPFVGGMPFMSDLLEGGPDSFVRAEVVLEDGNGGFRTVRAVRGTVQEGSADEAAGTFVLLPRDGSDAIEYMVSDDTAVILHQKGTIAGLNSNDDTIVVDVREDGADQATVRLVMQGDILKGLGGRQGARVMTDGGFGFSGGNAPGTFHFEFRGAPNELRDHLRMMMPDDFPFPFPDEDMTPQPAPAIPEGAADYQKQG